VPQVQRRGARRPRKATGALAKFAATNNRKSAARLLPGLERYLLDQHLKGLDDPERKQDIIHPSEISKSAWCPRATYNRIVWTGQKRPLPTDEKWRMQRETIFTEGDRIHEKWQTNWWAKGDLWGRWRCMHCTRMFWAQSPRTCEHCGSAALKYAEIPMFDQAHLLGGQGDGEIRDDDGVVMLEVKSVGDGTVRVEQPATFSKYNHKAVLDDGTEMTFFDMRGCFRDLKRPFPSHLRQSWTYLWMRAQMVEQRGWPECEGIVVLYEAKSTQATKEFFVKRNDDIVLPLLDICLDIVYALEKGKPPPCKEGRRSSCPECKPYEKGATSDPRQSPTDGARRGDDERQGSSREEEPGTSAEAGRRTTAVARRPDRPARRRPDSDDGSVHTLGGLLADAARDGHRGRRGRQ
jgi:hypothetical protein